MEEVFHLETGRVIGNDWVVRHDNRYFQVQAQSRSSVKRAGNERPALRSVVGNRGKRKGDRAMETPASPTSGEMLCTIFLYSFFSSWELNLWPDAMRC